MAVKKRRFLDNEFMLILLTLGVTGRQRPKAGANLQAQLAGGPADGGVRRLTGARHFLVPQRRAH